MWMLLFILMETISLFRAAQLYGAMSVACMVHLVGFAAPVWIFGRLLYGLNSVKGIGARSAIIIGIK